VGLWTCSCDWDWLGCCLLPAFSLSRLSLFTLRAGSCCSCLGSGLAFRCWACGIFIGCSLALFTGLRVFSLGICPFQSSGMNCCGWLSCFGFCCSALSCLFTCLKSFVKLCTFCQHDTACLDFSVLGLIFSCPSSSLLAPRFICIGCWYLPCKLWPYLCWMSFLFFVSRLLLFLTNESLPFVWCNRLNCFCWFALAHDLICCLRLGFLSCFLKANGFMILAH
jgi:hypothetical protein